jgi:HSP20 family molecular chaperone IbpA
MAEKETTMEVEKQEVQTVDESEPTRDVQVFVPRSDIYETDEEIVLVLDVPGTNADSIDITLEKNVLTINAYVDFEKPEGYALNIAEYAVGDYQRSFRLSDEVDQAKIKASVKDGVLRLHLPKAKNARTRKISVRAG